MKKRRNKNKNHKGRWVKGVISLIIISLITITIYKVVDVYTMAFKPNVELDEYLTIKIETGDDFRDVYQQLINQDALIDTAAFSWVAEKMKYKHRIKPGNYAIQDGMTNRELIRMLRAGNQQPVKVMFHNIGTLEQLAGTISKQIEADSAAISGMLNDKQVIESYGFTTETIYAMFIPNTYEFYWDTNAEEFMDRMKSEYDNFWDKKKVKKLDDLGMTKIEVSTLASIVDAETYMSDEMPKIAGVFLNRLERGIRLQADPTVKFAVGNIHMRRVLKKHLEIDSPYNTYRIDGLPPGPISIPSIAAIDAVLNAEDHDYIFFAAKPDFSGYHNFAKTLSQHLRYAREYQRALNRQRIYK
jgi:UPF0755 protein